MLLGGSMFDNIKFFTYEIKKAVTPDAINYQLTSTRKQDIQFSKAIPIMNTPANYTSYEDLPPNIQHADFSISGKLQSFSRPPLSEFALQNHYYIESFSIFHCGSNFFTKRTDYPSYLILYTYDGTGFLEYEGKTYHLLKGDGFFIDCMRPHNYGTEGNSWVHSVLHLNGVLLASLYANFIQNGSVLFSQPLDGKYQTNLEHLLRIYSTAQPYRDWQASNCLSSTLTDLLVKSLSNSGKIVAIPENMQYLIQFMENNYSSPLTLDYLTKFFGISRSHLTREFKKYTGYAPIEYLIQLRLDQAKMLLSSTSLPANKIAHMVGIHDINNFTNLFKKIVGMTPGSYRKGYCTNIEPLSPK